MEFVAWFTHKHIMHGFLWNLHKDHHHQSFFNEMIISSYSLRFLAPFYWS